MRLEKISILKDIGLPHDYKIIHYILYAVLWFLITRMRALCTYQNS
jgi:hypothetical protein